MYVCRPKEHFATLLIYIKYDKRCFFKCFRPRIEISCKKVHIRMDEIFILICTTVCCNARLCEKAYKTPNLLHFVSAYRLARLLSGQAALLPRARLARRHTARPAAFRAGRLIPARTAPPASCGGSDFYADEE